MYIFKYHPDNTIYRNGKYIGTYDEFKVSNNKFPITKGEFFEYGVDKFVLINNEGHDVAVDAKDHQVLIDAINNL